MNPLQRLINFFSHPDHKRTFSILAALAILAAIPLTVYIAQQQQDIRQRAEGSCIPYVDSWCPLPTSIPEPTPTEAPCIYPVDAGCPPPPPAPTNTPIPGGTGGGGNYCSAAGYSPCTVGTPQGNCQKDGKTCTAYSTYKCNYGGQNYCDNSTCAEPCTGGGQPSPTPGTGGGGTPGGQGGCCTGGPGQGSCRSWEKCDISNGSCASTFSCRSTTGCARDSDCGLPNNRCEGGQCKTGQPTGGCQSAKTLQARFWLEGKDPGQNPGTIATGKPVNSAVFRNNEGALAGSRVNNEYTPTDVSARISGPGNQSLDVSRINQFTPTQTGTYTLTATCGNNATGTATLTVTGNACTLGNQTQGNSSTCISCIVSARPDIRTSYNGWGHSACSNQQIVNNWCNSLDTTGCNSLKNSSQCASSCGIVSTPTPTSTFNTADVNRDGRIDILDFNIWFSAIKTGSIPQNTYPDINSDGKIDILDFNIWYNAIRAQR